MKHIAILLVLALLLAGCAAAPAAAADPTVSGDPAQNKYTLAFSLAAVQEGDGFYCGGYLYSNRLFYYDRQTGFSGILCSNPECTHDSTDCGGYVENLRGLAYADGKLYWIANDPSELTRDTFLWQGDLSGQNRVRLKRLSFDDVLLPYQPQEFVVHQGKLYIYGQADQIESGKTQFRRTVLVTGLDDSENFTTLFEETSSQYADAALRFVGSTLYLGMERNDGGTSYQIRKLDLTTGDCTEVFQEALPNTSTTAFWVTNQEEIYLPGCVDGHFLVWRIQDGSKTEAVSFPSSDFCPFVLDGCAVAISQDASGKRQAEIRSLSGDLLYEGRLLPDELPGITGDPNACSYAVVGGDADRLVLQLIDGTMNNYTVLLDVKNGLAPTLLWSSQS